MIRTTNRIAARPRIQRVSEASSFQLAVLRVQRPVSCLLHGNVVALDKLRCSVS